MYYEMKSLLLFPDEGSSCSGGQNGGADVHANRFPMSRRSMLAASISARSSSLGGHASSASPAAPGGPAASLGRESGFQSTTSLAAYENLTPAGSMASLGSYNPPALARQGRASSNRSSRSRSAPRQNGEVSSFGGDWPLRPLFFEVPQRDAAASPIFIGRRWLFAESLEHLGSSVPTSRGVTIAGAGGTGKTAVILQLVEKSCFGRSEQINHREDLFSPHRRSALSHFPANGDALMLVASHVVAYHFCQEDNEPTCSVANFVHSLAAQLTQAPVLRPYHDQLAVDQELQSRLSSSSCLSNPDAALEEGILEPLRALQGVSGIGSSPCLILVDALCAAETVATNRGRESIGAFLTRHLDAFPVWLKFLVTSRSDSNAFRRFPFHQISLDRASVDERVRKDVADFVRFRLSHSRTLLANVVPSAALRLSDSNTNSSPQDKFVDHLTHLSSGNFLHAKMTLDLVESGKIVIKSGSFKVLPVNVVEVFSLELNLRFPTANAFLKVKDILSTCLASEEPPMVSEVYHAVLAVQRATSGDTLTWPDFVGRFNQLSSLLVRRGDDTVMFYHPLFREWLLRQGEGRISLRQKESKYACDSRRGHLAVALRLCSSCLDNNGSEGVAVNPESILTAARHVLLAGIIKDGKFDDKAAESVEMSRLWLSLPATILAEALACQKNLYSPDAEASRLLLLSGSSPGATLMGGCPLLVAYAERGDEVLCSLLLEFGADPAKPRPSDGATALMLAASSGHVDVARLLVAAGAEIGSGDHDDRCALVHAASHGHLAMVEFILACDWTINVDQQQNNVLRHKRRTMIGMGEGMQQALVAAASAGRFQVVEYLLDMPQVDVNASDTLKGDTALCAAAAAGYQRW